MKIGSFFRFYLISAGILLLVLSVFEISAVRVVLIFLGYSFISPYLFKLYLNRRGINKGDTVIVTLEKSGIAGFTIEKLPGKALSSGNVGDIIEVEFLGKRASGEIVSGAGLIFPAEVKILFYRENQVKEP